MKKQQLYLLLFALLCTNPILSAQSTIYVNQQATGQNNGTSWTNAFTDLQTALTVSEDGDQIWVAVGTYYPTSGRDRNQSFVLKSGVRLYGGFKGTEKDKSERSKERSQTILSGDIGDEGNPLDNSYSVIFCENTKKGTEIDGFQIVEGNADDMAIRSKRRGGGIYFRGNNPENNTFLTIKNCFFRHNRAAQLGGAIMIEGGDKEAASATISNCFFEENFVTYYGSLGGGAIAKIGDDDFVDWTIVDSCEFHGNLTAYRGAAIYFKGQGQDHNISIKNSLFNKNGGSYFGGAIFHNGLSLHPHQSIDITNCTFKGNRAKDGGAIYYEPFQPRIEAPLNIHSA